MASAILSIALVALCLLGHSNGASILWTGYVGDNQWTTQNNWYPNSVPGPNDDVTIDKGTVFITIPTGVNSIVMGTNVDTPGNLTIYHALAVGAGGLQVKANGNLIINSGLETVQGTVSIDGTLTFMSGFISGLWTVSARGVGYFPGTGQRNIVAGSLTNNGNLHVDGVVGLNQSAQLINNNNLNVFGTTQFMVFDQSNAFVNSLQGTIIQTADMLRFQAPASIGALTINTGNIEVYNVVQFTQPISIPAGFSVSSLGNANTTFASVTGAGSLIASGRVTTLTTLNNIASVTAAGGNTMFTQGATANSITLAGGNINFGGNVVGQTVAIRGGILSGSGVIQGQTVTIQSIGVNIDTEITISQTGSVVSPSLLSFGTTGQLNVASGATLTVNTPMNFTGPTGTRGVVNNGTIAVGSVLQSTNIDVTGDGHFVLSGTASVITSTCRFYQSGVELGATGVIYGGNTNLDIKNISSAGAFVKGVLGDYSLECPVVCNDIKTKGTGAGATYAFSASATLKKN